MWEKKFEVRTEHGRDHIRSCMLSHISTACLTGRPSEISRVQGRIGRTCAEYGRPMIESCPLCYSSSVFVLSPYLFPHLHDLTRVLFSYHSFWFSYHSANLTIPFCCCQSN